MLDNHDEVAFKAVTYPIIAKLQRVSDELWIYQMKEDCEENFNFLLDWMEKLASVNRTSRSSIEEYVASLGYHLVDNPASEQ